MMESSESDSRRRSRRTGGREEFKIESDEVDDEYIE
jgi:hypothetical protein